METWKTLDIKSRFALVTAGAAFLAGWGLAIAGFIMPPKGDVTDAVLWILGQALIYTASVLGIGMYATHQIAKIRVDTKRYIDRELKEERNAAES